MPEVHGAACPLSAPAGARRIRLADRRLESESGTHMSIALEDVYKPSDDVVAREIEGEIIIGPWSPASAMPIGPPE